ncbi:MAG: biopolymer transporter ExbD [Bacteroidota bacterium]
MRRLPGKKTPRLDMNPMVDLSFLLVTFFMLTTQFKTEDPVQVQMPESQSRVKLPEQDLVTILVSEEGTIYYSIDGKFTRKRLLNRMGQKHGITFTDEERYAFSLQSSFGVPVAGLKSWLGMAPNDRKNVEQPGIPCDSSLNELEDWIVMSRVVNPSVRVAIKGDQKTPYPVVRRIMKTLVAHKVTRFNFITELEPENG